MTAITPPSGPTTADKMRGLPWSLAANAANSVFAQFTFFGSVFILFLSELSISNTQIGILLSLFPFMGLVALFIAPAVARFGYKRTYITFWGLRKVMTAFLLMVPWVLSQFGPEGAVIFITVITAGFGLCRAIAETGYYPWIQEFVPASIRGKYSATNNVISSLTSMLAVGVASYVLGLALGLNRFMLLFAVGVVFGGLSVWMFSRIPGGAPVRDASAKRVTYRDMLKAARDRNLLLYLGGIALLAFGTGPLYSFLPLFMEDQIGLSESNVVSLATAALIGGLLSSHLLGWSADRYGSKPVMISGVVLKIILPFGWLLMPRNTDASLFFALLIALFQGVADIAWAVGSGRLLFVSVVPSERKTEFMAVYYAAVGIIGGASQVLGGGLLDAFSGISGQFLIFTLDPFTPLMVASVILPLLSLLVFRRVRADSPVSVSEFAGMFVQGNPVYALETMVRYYRARDERSTVVMTEKMGQAKSPLTVDEMVEALADPRFNVRLEAIISIARMKPHPRLTEALVHVLNGTELALSAMSAWALGRMGDNTAIPTLRAGLDSGYRSIQGQTARALGTLGDREIIPLLHERLKTETDKGLMMAYAAALGNLRATETIDTLFDLLRKTENEGARMELALSLARMMGEEHHFIRLLRQSRSDPGTAASQELSQLRNRLSHSVSEAMRTMLLDSSNSFARDDLDGGITALVQMIRALPPSAYYDDLALRMLHSCADGLEACGVARLEYLIVALHVLHSGVRG
ncbi:MAG: MFS transporter [Anaerolineae bacterium]|nr:MFS transporter [Anaerolineae bacterium]